ncbi:hypothetical protein [Aeromicrobium sp. 179-A 4D2 NHS]|uniref:hypothetical protein n=1 Tax=Aeromicrobium sp. 179-A 4D2 NHS TaxID=3142375 RepID=UPI0039A2D62F
MSDVEAKVAESIAAGVATHGYQYSVSGPWGSDVGGDSDIECLAAAKKAHEDLVKVYGDHREVTARRRMYVTFHDDSEFTGPEETLGSFGRDY